MSSRCSVWTVVSLVMLSGMRFAAPLQAQVHEPEMEPKIVAWTNYYRNYYGRQTVRQNPQLTQIARGHAYHMAHREKMAHELDGSTLQARVRRGAYAYQVCGENVAYNEGYANPAWKFFEGWMGSAGHWENIQNPQYSEIGVGVYRSPNGKYYACQVFGAPLNVAAPQVHTVPYRGYTSVPRGFLPESAVQSPHHGRPATSIGYRNIQGYVGLQDQHLYLPDMFYQHAFPPGY